ncbi:MAG: DUF937 domain-containing protein [Acetobacteraceae bacterium]|nr:DUF937 domain-containing protein [Acetobacteraceae bacterium]
MRLLDEVYDEIRREPESSIAPLGSVLRDLLGGPRGTLANLADRFTQAGLAEIMASWIHDGPNLPVTAGQLRTVLGAERARDFATEAGMPEDDLLWTLARYLPRVVDRMTPEGRVTTRENPGTLPV